jgi:hypothetical protein
LMAPKAFEPVRLMQRRIRGHASLVSRNSRKLAASIGEVPWSNGLKTLQ